MDQFSPSSFEVRGFNPFNKKILSVFDISSAFYHSIWLNIKTIQIQSWNMYETSNKVNKIWLIWLNSRISKDGGLNWSKVLK